MSINDFTRSFHLFLTGPRIAQLAASHTISLKPTITQLSLLLLGYPHHIFFPGFYTKSVTLVSCIYHALPTSLCLIYYHQFLNFTVGIILVCMNKAKFISMHQPVVNHVQAMLSYSSGYTVLLYVVITIRGLSL